MLILKDFLQISTEVEFAVGVVAAAIIACLLVIAHVLWKYLAILPAAVAQKIRGKLLRQAEPRKFPRVTHETAH